MRVTVQNAAASIVCSACLVGATAGPGITALDARSAPQIVSAVPRVSADYALTATLNPFNYAVNVANTGAAAAFAVGVLPFNVALQILTQQGAGKVPTTAANTITAALGSVTGGTVKNGTVQNFVNALTNIGDLSSSAPVEQVNEAIATLGTSLADLANEVVNGIPVRANPITYAYNLITTAAIAAFDVAVILPLNVPLLTLTGQGTKQTAWLKTVTSASPTTAITQVKNVETAVNNFIFALTDQTPALADPVKQVVSNISLGLQSGVTSTSNFLSQQFNPFQYAFAVTGTGAVAVWNIGSLAVNLPYQVLTAADQAAAQAAIEKARKTAQTSFDTFVQALSNSLPSDPNPANPAAATAVAAVLAAPKALAAAAVQDADSASPSSSDSGQGADKSPAQAPSAVATGRSAAAALAGSSAPGTPGAAASTDTTDAGAATPKPDVTTGSSTAKPKAKPKLTWSHGKSTAGSGSTATSSSDSGTGSSASGSAGSTGSAGAGGSAGSTGTSASAGSSGQSHAGDSAS